MALIPEEVVAQIIDRSDIVETISGYLPIKRAGRNFKAPCPFHHEKTPSFVVNPDKQIFHCFGCGVGGNVVSFVMKHEKLDFPDALKLLAQRANIQIPTSASSQTPGGQLKEQIFRINELALNYFHQNLILGKETEAKVARDYLKERGVSFESVQQFKLGYAYDQWDGLIKFLREKDISLQLMEKAGLIIPRDGKEGFYDRFRNRIVFPIFDSMGHPRAFGARAMGESSAKYINSPETPAYTKGQHLFGFNDSKSVVSQLDHVIIVEGYMDFIIPFQAGIQNLVASLGTALTVDQIRLVRRYTKNVVFLYDMDAAGEAAMMRSFDALIEEGMNVKVASLTQGDDPDSFVRKSGGQEFTKRILDSMSLFDYKLQVLKKQYTLNSIESKAKVAEEMLKTISKFENAVIRSGYMTRLSRELNVAEVHLVTEFNKIVGKAPVSKAAENIKSNPVVKQVRAVEREILRLLLEDETLIAQTKAEVEVGDFQDEKIRNVISQMFDLFDQGKDVSASSLLNRFDDQHVTEMISGLLAEEATGSGNNKEKMFKDYVLRIKNDRLKSQFKGLRDQIQEAELAGDHLKLNELKKEFNQLIKR